MDDMAVSNEGRPIDKPTRGPDQLGEMIARMWTDRVLIIDVPRKFAMSEHVPGNLGPWATPDMFRDRDDRDRAYQDEMRRG